MSKIKIMCTSTGCIEYAPERYRHLGIDIIRVHVLFEGKEYLEGLDLDPVEFYEKLETLEDPKKNLPKTAIPTYQEISAHFDKAIEEGYDEVIAFAISAFLGGTYNQIRLVAEDYKDKIKINVVNTKITSFGEGMLAIKAQEMVNKGMSSEDILKEVAWMMKTQQFIGIDDSGFDQFSDGIIAAGFQCRIAGCKYLCGISHTILAQQLENKFSILDHNFTSL